MKGTIENFPGENKPWKPEPDPAGGNSEFSLVGCDNWFVPEERELTLYSWGQGELNPPEGTQGVAEGEIIDLEAQAEEGWEFKEWVGLWK